MKLTTKQTSRKRDGKVAEKVEGIPSDVLERLLRLLDVRKIRQVDLATAMGRSKDWASRTMKGERGLSVSTLQTLSQLFDVDLHWLLTGEGMMFKGKVRTNSMRPTDYVDDVIVRLNKLRDVIDATTGKPSKRASKKL